MMDIRIWALIVLLILTPCDGEEIHPSSPWLALESSRLTAGRGRERGQMSLHCLLASISPHPSHKTRRTVGIGWVFTQLQLCRDSNTNSN